MYLDDFKVHKMEEVKNFLWSRGFLRVLIGGGCTFILCNPDLDCHADVERQYLEMDVEYQAAELEKRPWKIPEKSRQGFCDDMVCIWKAFPHKKRGAETFQLCGLGARITALGADYINYGFIYHYFSTTPRRALTATPRL